MELMLTQFVQTSKKSERRMRMKRLLVLALIISVAGLANASLSLVADQRLDPGGEVQIQLVNDLGGLGGFTLGYLIVPEGMPGVLSMPVILPGAGNQSSATPFSEPGFGTGYEITLADTYPGGAGLVAGPQMTFTFFAPMGYWVFEVDFYNDALGYNAPETDIIWVFPEPMTILLLGFGGLFIRRK
jgi:hypothetical protein